MFDVTKYKKLSKCPWQNECAKQEPCQQEAYFIHGSKNDETIYCPCQKKIFYLRTRSRTMEWDEFQKLLNKIETVENEREFINEMNNLKESIPDAKQKNGRSR